MAFLYPYFLFALAAISIPIIVHLFNFRTYKVVYFSNVRFLKNIKQETKAKSQLKHLLILLCRILTIAAIVLAFSQPYIPANKAQNVQTPKENDKVCIYIDNSFSMAAEGETGSLFNQAKNKAQGIVEAYPAGTHFLFMNNDFELKNQHFINREQFMQNLSELKISPNVRKFSELYARQQDFLTTTPHDSLTRKTIYFISDFQKTIADFQNVKNDSSISTYLLPLATQPTNNIYIDSIWFETPGRKVKQNEQLFVKVVNNSEQAFRGIPLKLSLNNELKAVSSFDIDKQATQIVELNYTNTSKGIVLGKIELSDYPITYDNTFFLSYKLAENIKLLIIEDKGENNYLKALFGEDEYIKTEFVKTNEMKPAEFRNYHAIILNRINELSSGFVQEIINFVATGGTVVFFPDLTAKHENYNKLLNPMGANPIVRLDSQKVEISKVDFHDEIYNKVFKTIDKDILLPKVYKQFLFSNTTRSKNRTILETENANAFLSLVNKKNGKFYVFSSSLDEKAANFPKHPLFVPTLYNIVLYSQGHSKLYYSIGSDTEVEIQNHNGVNQEMLHVYNEKLDYDFIPQLIPSIEGINLRLNVRNSIRKAGIYFVKDKTKTIQGLAFNYARDESDLFYHTKDDLHENIANFGLQNFSVINAKDDLLVNTIEQLSKGTQLWKYCLVLALLFIASEIALVRLLR